jgi:hypothetical protein
MFLLVGFNRRVMQVCGDIMGPGLWESFQGLLAKHRAQLPISFSGISFLFMQDCAPSAFIGNWALVVLYFRQIYFGGICFSD